jgi:dynein heavy chain
LNSFLWIIDKEQFKLKIDAHIWPYKIALRIKETLENIGLEIEKFEKVQLEDEIILQDKIEFISNAILKLTIEINISKVFEIAVDINKNWKLISELHSFGQVLNHRQKLFGHTVCGDYFFLFL